MNNVERAGSCFNSGFRCSQAATYAERFGLKPELALPVASAFGGGMSHLGETRGAVTGAFMAIGLKYGRTGDADAKNTKKKIYRLVKEFAGKFKTRNGSLSCTERLGCDLSTPEGINVRKNRTSPPRAAPRSRGMLQSYSKSSYNAVASTCRYALLTLCHCWLLSAPIRVGKQHRRDFNPLLIKLRSTL